MRLPRYGPGARWYDLLSGERFVYRAGRALAIRRLQLRRGDRVLDVGCGTGLSFELLLEAVGTGGAVTGVDSSRAMLRRAEVRSAGRDNICLRRGNASRLADLVGDAGPFDAALFMYSLSIIDDWRAALDQALEQVRPGGRVAVVDMALPTGRWRVLWPLARLAMFTGGADTRRAPWRRLLQSTTRTSHDVIRGGHVHVAVGVRTVES